MTAPLQLHDYACAKVRRRLDSYLAGELSVDLSHEILEHLDRCPECRSESDAREKLRASFRRVAGATPGPRDGFEDEVRALMGIGLGAAAFGGAIPSLPGGVGTSCRRWGRGSQTAPICFHPGVRLSMTRRATTR